MKTGKLVRAYDSLMSRITIVKAGGYMFTWMPDRRAHITRNGRVIKHLVPSFWWQQSGSKENF